MKRGNVVTGTNHLNQVPGTLARNQNTFWYVSDELEHDISTERLDLTFLGRTTQCPRGRRIFFSLAVRDYDSRRRLCRQPYEIVSLLNESRSRMGNHPLFFIM